MVTRVFFICPIPNDLSNGCKRYASAEHDSDF